MTGRPTRLRVRFGMIDDVLPTAASIPIIGRRDEISLLAQLIGLRAGASGNVLLGGDAGAGKSRLIQEIGAQAQAAGWRVVVGHCLDFGDGAMPYLAFSEAFGRLALEDPETVRRLVETSPVLARLLPGHPLAPAGDQPASTDRGALFEAVHGALADLTGTSAVLLVVEDVHWADQSTRELLTFLFTRRFGGNVSIVASYRSDDLHRRHPLRPTLAEWGRLAGVHRLELSPLPERDVRLLVGALHPEPLSEPELRDIVGRAEGNPFFIEELVAAAQAGGGALPTGLADLMLVRLDQLDDVSRLAVRAVAVVGRRATHELLARGVDLDEATLEQALRAAVEANVLVAAGGDGYTFRHALLAEAVYLDLLPGERTRLHAAYAKVLAERGSAGSAAELARHARAAHDLVTATQASIQAGNEAMAIGGPDEAARHYEAALELCADPQVSSAIAAAGGFDQVGLVVSAAVAMAAAGHPFRAIALVEHQLLQLPDGATALDRARLLHTVASTALSTDSKVDLLALTTEAFALVPAEPPSPWRARILLVHARANADRARDDDAVRWAGEALTMAHELGLADVAADAATTLALLDERAGNPDASETRLMKAVAGARSTGEVAAELRGLYNLGTLHYELGRLPQALAVYQETWARAKQFGRLWAPYGLDARAMVAVVAYVSGDWDLALRTVDVRGESPPDMAAALLTSIGLEVAAGRGDAGGLEDLAGLRPWWQYDGVIAITSAGAMIDLLGQSGDLVAAREIYEDATATVDALWHRPDFQARLRLGALLLGHLASAAAHANLGERTDLRDRGDEVAARIASTADAGSVRRRRGPEGEAWLARVAAEHLRLRWLAGLDDISEGELVGVWRRTVAAFERFGHVYETARSQARLAAVLAATDQKIEAARLEAGARTVATRLGARPLLQELRTPGRPDRPARGAPVSRLEIPLTARESEVLAIVAEGRSNREIALQLFISAKTVSVHISNILAKLGAAGRTEAVAVARRRGLIGDGSPGAPDSGG
jgi:DNA-binding CsgD family transcriptional regulator/tetratricopeptide (TPR) repeat protein